ncbi:phosphatidylglycerol lysyltransferase domain-containing protein [Yinghuangia seranimata]|nr:phosphatidylglycerol lysyltransferase domain-containing protein [Yinghuangia seranimata]MDI2131973.1 phosphatidylglycerol lysyltransferase domain-containing protein [Yinghuangia seranimata]
MQHIAARVLIWYLRIVAAFDLFAAISVPLRTRVRRHDTGEFFTPFLLTTSFTTAALAIFLAVMLNRRKRAAWVFTAILLIPTFTLYVLAVTIDPDFRRHAFNWISTGITLIPVLALAIGRREFYARGERGNVVKAGVVLLGGLAVAVVLGATLVSLTDKIGEASMGEKIHYAVLRVFTLARDDQFDNIAVPRATDIVINIAALALFLLVLYVLFRAPKGTELLGPDDEVKLRELLDKWGERDSLGYFALRRDKAVMWSPSGKSAVAYRVVGGVSLASGDPIGDPEAWPGAIEPWLEEARENAWVPAVMGASEEAGTIYARHGLDALELGDEAIVEVSEFTLDGRAMRVVRQAYNRVKRAGYTTRIRRHEDIPIAEMSELLDLADHWRDGETERGFSMALGRLGDPDDGRCVMVECTDADGKLRALLSFVPWGPHGISLDLMRRDRESENGLLEFMVLDVISQAKQHDVEQISLNFAMFRSVFERGSKLGAGPVLRLWKAVLTFFSRWWQIESLYRANAKYRPIWEPRYLCFRKASELPRIGLASARAEGFLEAPSLPSLFRRRHAERVAEMAKHQQAAAAEAKAKAKADEKHTVDH